MIEEIIIIVLTFIAGMLIGYSLGLTRGKKLEREDAFSAFKLFSIDMAEDLKKTFNKKDYLKFMKVRADRIINLIKK